MAAAASPAPRRSPDAGGYARGEETRRKVVEAALQVFGEEGYERASTRQIAGRAGVTPPALQYYFDSKEGLHRACAQFIIDRMREVLAPDQAAAEQAAAGGDAEAALEALCNLLETLIDFGLTSADAKGWSRFMGRCQADGAGPALPLIREGVVRPFQLTCARLVGVIIGKDAGEIEVLLRVGAIMGQFTAFQLHKENTLAFLGWTDYGPAQVAIIKRVLRAQTRGALSARL